MAALCAGLEAAGEWTPGNSAFRGSGESFKVAAHTRDVAAGRRATRRTLRFLVVQKLRVLANTALNPVKNVRLPACRLRFSDWTRPVLPAPTNLLTLAPLNLTRPHEICQNRTGDQAIRLH